MPNEAQALPPFLYAALLVLARVSGLFIFVPIPGIRSGPDIARIVLSASITLALQPFWPNLTWTDPTWGQLLRALLLECLLGLLLGLLVGYLAEAFSFGAQMLSLQAGYSFASTIDPATQAESGVLSVLAQLVAGLLFFAAGLDRQVLQTLADTLVSCPPGSFTLGQSVAVQVARLGTEMLAAGLRLVFPVVLLLVSIDLTLGLLARLNGHMQLLNLAFSAKMLIALLGLNWLVPLWPKIYASSAAHLFGSLPAMLERSRLP